MFEAFVQLLFFTAKLFVVFIFIAAVLITFLALIAKSKEKLKAGRIIIKNINKKYAEITETLFAEILPKRQFKKFLKEKKITEKKKQNQENKKNIYVIDFQGDMRASAVNTLREEITAILNIATINDEVVVRLESAGGVVHGYGLAAAQLLRLKEQKIPLTVAIDKVAASGGYMMACVADKIICAPFAIVGSIGVVVQLPNFHRLLQDKHIDYEMLTAGEYKRTLTIFGENTEAGREKLKQEIEEIHALFKNLISSHRQHIDIQKVATGEYWPGQQAIELKLVDKIQTSDDYLLTKSKEAELYEINYEMKKSFLSKFSSTANAFREKWSL